MAMSAIYRVFRLPGAPQRRAGRDWVIGETEAKLMDAEAKAIAADPGYRIEPRGGPPAARSRARRTPRAA